MSDKINILKQVSREEQYKNLLPQIEALLSNETDTIANMANLSAVLKEAFHFLWVGFYLVKREELVLGPFQGKVACTRIKFGRGVCGTAWKEERIVVVSDVNTFAGHIACDADSRSEIVVPIFQQDKIVALLDIDSEVENNFTEIDAKYLNQIIKLIQE